MFQAIPASIPERLAMLHTLLPQHPVLARQAIDAHLLASWVCASNPPSICVLDPRDVFHYNNLPNLVPILRQCLVSNTWESDILGSLMSPFCLHINRTLRPQYLIPSTRTTQTAALNTAHGLILGLYPFNVRHAAYERRVALVGWLRQGMTAPDRTEFVRRNESLLTLSMMEYLANVVCDFCPVEEALLVRHGQCRFIVNHLCDAFRHDAEDIPLDELDARAAQSLASVMRQLKLCNHRPCKRTSGRSQTRKVSNEDIGHALDTPPVSFGSSNIVAQIQLVRPDLGFEQIQALEHIWSNVSVRLLPRNVYVMQLSALQMRGSCAQLQSALCAVHICMTCAMGGKPSIFQHRCAWDCASRQLVCIYCPHKPVMHRVHMLGRSLRIRGASFFLCPRCLHPTQWHAGTIPLQGCSACQARPPPSPERCAACDSRVIALRREIVDWENLRLTRIPLCHRHAKASSRSALYDLRSLQDDVVAHQSRPRHR